MAQAGVAIHEYKPLAVKQAVAGYGGADKKQMQEMVRLTLGLPSIIKSDDAAARDAVCVFAFEGRERTRAPLDRYDIRDHTQLHQHLSNELGEKSPGLIAEGAHLGVPAAVELARDVLAAQDRRS